MGKSSLAAKYATKYKQMYPDGVLYFDAESWSTLSSSVLHNVTLFIVTEHFVSDVPFTLSLSLQLTVLSLTSAGRGLRDDNTVLLSSIYTKSSVLLVYDGADNLPVLTKVFPRQSAHVHVLVTTRCGDLTVLQKVDYIVSLGRLEGHDAMSALNSWSGREPMSNQEIEMEAAARLLSESPIEGLPLAIVHAATFVRKATLSYQDYYQLLRTRVEELKALALDMDKLLHYFKAGHLRDPLLLSGVTEPVDLQRLSEEDINDVVTGSRDIGLITRAQHFMSSTSHTHLTWQLDIESIAGTDPKALSLLEYASFMASKNIPVKVLRPLVFGDSAEYQFSLAVTSLSTYCLVECLEGTGGYTVSIHPLVQSTVLERMQFSPDEKKQKLARLCHSLMNLIPSNDFGFRDYSNDSHFLDLIPHLYSVAEKAVSFCAEIEQCDGLVHDTYMIAYAYEHVDVMFQLCEQQWSVLNKPQLGSSLVNTNTTQYGWGR